MATFLCKTKGNANPKGRPRVYFTCHPEDFSRYFEKMCEDIFRTHDCAVYYTEDVTAPLGGMEADTDLGQMNLFVVPVTFKLLSSPNRAMDVDIAYAKRHRIAILPFMMESGIDALYAQPDKFGERQYISPYSTDTTEISYADKLKRYLEAVLISDEAAQRVRNAFDAYIFLSYRKKDRYFANRLIRLIHKNPEYRDIAIWYDEFLTPGESFMQNIDKALQESKLFALLVTPNLLEEPDGKPNFVMATEYPAAIRAGMEVLPAEMVDTDKEQLREKYAGLPECVDAQDESALRARLLAALDKLAGSENDRDPEHNFLIGLAYRDGIDVEVDRERALALITSAAQADLPEAMAELYRMYTDGFLVELDYRKAVLWAQGLAAYYQSRYGEEHEDSLAALGNLAITYGKLGEHQKALELQERIYRLSRRVYGDRHPDTLRALNNLAGTYSDLGDYRMGLEYKQQAYALYGPTLGAEHPETLIALSNLATSYVELGDL
ncbi:MAG: tetratricopeptide repeat protein, partial [Clostridia bacterium]|nr:tetratricopeptide repeat protein [Clostridia bacterium]